MTLSRHDKATAIDAEIVSATPTDGAIAPYQKPSMQRSVTADQVLKLVSAAGDYRPGDEVQLQRWERSDPASLQQTYEYYSSLAYTDNRSYQTTTSERHDSSYADSHDLAYADNSFHVADNSLSYSPESYEYADNSQYFIDNSTHYHVSESFNGGGNRCNSTATRAISGMRGTSENAWLYLLTFCFLCIAILAGSSR